MKCTSIIWVQLPSTSLRCIKQHLSFLCADDCSSAQYEVRSLSGAIPDHFTKILKRKNQYHYLYNLNAFDIFRLWFDLNICYNKFITRWDIKSHFNNVNNGAQRLIKKAVIKSFNPNEYVRWKWEVVFKKRCLSKSNFFTRRVLYEHKKSQNH